MALVPRKPQPQDFPGGEDDPQYHKAIAFWKRQWEDKRAHPERWGGVPQPPKSTAPVQPKIG